MARVGVVIVTYRNTAMLGELVQEVARQSAPVDEVVIIDNGADPRIPALARGAGLSFQYVPMDTNRGNAGGYYEGIQRAAAHNDLIWLLDDDVSVHPDALAHLLRALEGLEQSNRVGAVRSWCTARAPFQAPRRTASFAWRGTLVRTPVIEMIGLPKKEYFLYGDDTEWALRMRRHGLAIFWIPASLVIERRLTPSYDAMRYYYAFRNQVHQYLRYGCAGELVRVGMYALKVSLCERDKSAAVWEGVRDGVRGRLGKNERYCP